jgi:hypothetical protein
MAVRGHRNPRAAPFGPPGHNLSRTYRPHEVAAATDLAIGGGHGHFTL